MSPWGTKSRSPHRLTTRVFTSSNKVKKTSEAGIFAGNVFFNCNNGRKYGSWITGARDSSILDSNVSSGNTIKNGVGIIESLLQDELIARYGLPLAINTSSFDIAYDDRSSGSWEYAISIFDQASVYDIIDELAMQMGIKWFFNYNNEFTIKAYDSTNSLDYYFYSDISQTNESLNRGHIIGDIELTSVPLDDIYSEVKVNYGYDYARDLYKEQVYVNRHTSNWDTVTDTTAVGYCEDAWENFKIEKIYTIDARAINDKETAERLCNYLASRLTRRLHSCSFTTGLEGLQMEIGDFINIQHPVINGMWSSTYTTKKWEVYAITFNPDMTVDLSAIEV